MSLVHPQPLRMRYMEDVLQKTGWGLYYKFLLGFTCLSNFIGAITLLSLYFVLPLSTCDTMLKKDDVIVCHICLALGRSIGGFLMCCSSDANGTKCIIPKTFIMNFMACFIIAFSNNPYTFFGSAFLLGSGLQTNKISVTIHLADILPARKRGFYIVLTDLIWTVGYFIIPVCVYFIKDYAMIDHQGMDMRVTIWRAIFSICGGLNLLMACVCALLEESPRYLLFKRRYITTLLVLKQFYAINKSKYSETFEMTTQSIYDIIYNYDVNLEPEPLTTVGQLIFFVKTSLRMVRLILSRRFIWTVAILTFCQLLTLNGLPDMNILLAKVVKYPNETSLTGFDLVHVINTDGENCTHVQKGLFENFFLVSVNIFFGQILLLGIIDKIGRKIPIFLSLMVCGLSSFVLIFNRKFPTGPTAASTFMMGYSMLQSAVFIVAIESFPTAIRSTAVSITHLYPLFISCLIYKWLVISCNNMFMLFGILAQGISVVVFFLPDLVDRPMTE